MISDLAVIIFFFLVWPVIAILALSLLFNPIVAKREYEKQKNLKWYWLPIGKYMPFKAYNVIFKLMLLFVVILTICCFFRLLPENIFVLKYIFTKIK